VKKSIATGKLPIRRRRGQGSGKNQALGRWLDRVATQSNDGSQQWWDDFDAFLRRSRLRLRLIGG
jgi:hypothetical protein